MAHNASTNTTISAMYSDTPTTEWNLEKRLDCGQNTTRRKLGTFMCLTASTTAILTLALVLLFLDKAATFAAATSRWSPMPSTCGTSAEEARAQGCVFDYVIMGWIPPQCYDHRLSDEFINSASWQAWDPMSGLEVDGHELRRGERSLIVTADFHRMHCLFVIRKIHRAALAGRPLDGYVASYNHTVHCEELLMGGHHHENVMAFLKFPGCVDKTSLDLVN